MINKLKEMRLERGLTQKEVAKLLGFKSDDRICLWEKGKAMPSVINLLKICKIYEVKVEELYLLE